MGDNGIHETDKPSEIIAEDRATAEVGDSLTRFRVAVF